MTSPEFDLFMPNEKRAVETQNSINLAGFPDRSVEVDLGTLPRIGITHWEQVLLYLPRDYVDRTHVRNQLLLNERACYSLTVTNMPHRKLNKRKSNSAPLTIVPVSDGVLAADIYAFGRHPWENLRPGDHITIEATAKLFFSQLTLQKPKLIPNQKIGLVVAEYRGKAGQVSEDMIYQKTRYALQHHLQGTCRHIMSFFPNMDEANVMKRIGARYTSLGALFRALHAPGSVLEGRDALDAAYSLCALEIINTAERKSVKEHAPNSIINLGIVTALAKLLPFSLNQQQQQAVSDICSDLASPYRMHRLLSGDCGSGKTIVTMLPAIAAWQAGAKIAFLSPNTLIANQTVAVFRQYFQQVPVVLVSSGTGAPVIDNNPILIGTTALLHFARKNDWKADFLVIDEQEKFSLEQRSALCHEDTNILEATATCIPRTAAMVEFSGMSESILENSIFERNNVITSIMDASSRTGLFEKIKAAVSAQQKVALIYPLVHDDDKKIGVSSAAESWNSHFPGRVGMLHGQMRDEEKHDVLNKMKSGQFDILVSTTVLERGIDTSFDMMIVISPERHGVVGLHQLRGRVARHGGSGEFILFTPDELPEHTLNRLSLLTVINNGFELAEQDMNMRGFGDLGSESEEQSGISKSGFFFNIKMTPERIKSLLFA
jgi:ATP-dependent DNA helicase RecG